MYRYGYDESGKDEVWETFRLLCICPGGPLWMQAIPEHCRMLVV